MRPIIFSASLLLILAACSSSSDQQATNSSRGTPSDGTVSAKATAPVDIEVTDLMTSSGTLRITFRRPTENVTLQVYGVDGLTVQAAPPIGTTFQQGEVATVPVTFVPGPGRSYLVAFVTGKFAGRQDKKVASFAVGEATEAQRAAADAGVITDSEGRRIRVNEAKRDETKPK